MNKVKEPRFTKRHYVAIANVLWGLYNDPEVISISQVDKMLDHLVEVFKEDNSLFNEERFRKAARHFQ